MVCVAVALGADDPEDTAQEAFVRLYKSAGRLKDPDLALPYLRRTVVNLTNSRLRHLRVARRNRLRQEAVESAESQVLQQERTREVVTAVRALPRRQRQVIALRYWATLSESEIAETLDVSVGTVKSTASKAKAQLSLTLKEIR